MATFRIKSHLAYFETMRGFGESAAQLSRKPHHIGHVRTMDGPKE